MNGAKVLLPAEEVLSVLDGPRPGFKGLGLYFDVRLADGRKGAVGCKEVDVLSPLDS